MTHRLRPDALLWREVEGEIVALDVRTSEYLAVNATGASLWPQLREGASRDALVATLVEQFQIDAQTARRDVDAFLEVLRAQDVLE